jgi:hypothetical protein
MFKISLKKGRNFGFCSATIVSKVDSSLAMLFNLSKSQIVIHINFSNGKHIPSVTCPKFQTDIKK